MCDCPTCSGRREPVLLRAQQAAIRESVGAQIAQVATLAVPSLPDLAMGAVLARLHRGEEVECAGRVYRWARVSETLVHGRTTTEVERPAVYAYYTASKRSYWLHFDDRMKDAAWRIVSGAATRALHEVLAVHAAPAV